MENLHEGYWRAYDRCQDEDLGSHILCLENYILKKQVESSKSPETEQDGQNKGKPEQFDTADKWITITDAADLSGFNRGTISRWADKGKIRHNEEKNKKRRVLKSSILLKRDEKEQKELLRDAKELKEDSKKLPDYFS